MKKLLFMFATAALVLSACSSEDDIVQGGGSLPQLGASGTVGFDVYTAAATKAGTPAGVMTTDKLKTAGNGFGVFAVYQDGVDYAASSKKPNFMFNEHVYFSGSWTYSPLKYWPNETVKDPQSTGISANIDKLSFFAYAPYVNLTTPGNMTVNTTGPVTEPAYTEASPTSGILAITKEDRSGDPLVEWKYSTDLDNNVDLLWGVAPAGMSYQDVTGGTTTATAGLPLLNMVKPDKDQKMKFLFQHALSRIGLTVVSAIDQVPAGDDGGVYSNAETRVLIKSVEVYGNFGKQGVLNLNNTSENTANWIEASIAKSGVGDLTPLYSFTVANGAIAKNLRYEGVGGVTSAGTKEAAATAFAALNGGVLPSEQTLLAGGADPSKKVTDPTYAFGTTLYKQDVVDYVVAKAKTAAAEVVYSTDGNDYTRVYDGTGTGYEVDGSTQFYTVAATALSGENKVPDGQYYYVLDGTSYIKTLNDTGADKTDGGYTISATPITATYDAGDYYTALTPRYFMVIPTAATDVKVKITYAVVTYDSKLGGYCSEVENAITKTTSLTLQSGKSYNLKLILGMTSVKLSATVADWQVDGDNEVYLPQNKAE